MVVHYQPIVDIETREVVRVESFCRVPASHVGLGTPIAFLASVERSGRIRDFTQWMLQTVLDDRRSGNYSLPISINLAFANLFESDLVSRVRALLEAYAVDASDLTFELVDGIQQIEDGYGLETMRHLAIDGVRFAIDGFGANLSQIADLEVMRLPVQELKIDASELEKLIGTRDPAIKRMQRFIDDEGLTVVAKCVETPFQLEAAKTFGCRYAQGYLFAQPLGSAAFRAWLRTNAGGDLANTAVPMETSEEGDAREHGDLLRDVRISA